MDCILHSFQQILHIADIAIFFSDLLTEPKGQLLLINGKTEDEVCRSLERVLLTMRITNSEPKVCPYHHPQSFIQGK